MPETPCGGLADRIAVALITAGRSMFRALALLACATSLSAAALSVARAQPQTPAQAQSETTRGSLSTRTVTTFRADHTVEDVETLRIIILNEGSLGSAGQQRLSYIDGVQKLDIVEAYTEKPDGRRVTVPDSGIITRDAEARGNVYTRDQKQIVVIFPDLAVGDTVVLTWRLTRSGDTFSGHYSQVHIFPRQLSLGTSQVQIIAPKEAYLNISNQGLGFETDTKELDGARVTTVTHHPGAKVADEAGAVSALDREPMLFVSTFRDYEALANAYWKEAAPKAEVTPALRALAQQIVQNIAGKREQAEAISTWVKRNVRYVAVYLGPGRVVPNSAEDVLQSRYGDCKDHATLMMALLSAAGIESEQVLIQAGNAYTLPSTPVIAAFSHVIIYLPQFGLYDDPTVRYSAFGVLDTTTYDKPVVRVSARGAVRDHTPAMNPDDHVTINRTKLSVAADGTVTGETRQITKGVFATNARNTTLRLQQLGAETAAEKQLASLGTAGKGRYEIPVLDNAAEYTLAGAFKLNQRMKTPLLGSYPIPVGMPIHVRPGQAFFGRRQESRTMPFVCFAGRQVEELELLFADDPPPQKPFTNRRLERKLYTYTSEYKLEGRTLRLKREFVSRVPSQVCDAAIEEQLGKDLATIGESLKTTMVFEKAARPEIQNAAPQKEENFPDGSKVISGSVPPSEP
jgi:hypothetical protein